MGGNSTTWMNTAILVTCIRNFRKNRGPVSGILKGYVGLSTAIFTDICSALFANDPSSFLLLLAVVPFVVCFTAVLFLREIPPSSTAAEEQDEVKYFSIINVVAVCIAVYLLAFDISGPHGTVFSKLFTVMLLILLASPLFIPLYLMMKNFIRSNSGNLDFEGNNIATVPLLAEQIVEKEEMVMVPLIGEDHTIFEAMRTVDFWILFFSFLCGVGTGLAVMNNLGQMGLAMGYVDVSIFVSFTSIWGFFGRIFSGSVSEYFIKYVN